MEAHGTAQDNKGLNGFAVLILAAAAKMQNYMLSKNL